EEARLHVPETLCVLDRQSAPGRGEIIIGSHGPDDSTAGSARFGFVPRGPQLSVRDNARVPQRPWSSGSPRAATTSFITIVELRLRNPGSLLSRSSYRRR